MMTVIIYGSLEMYDYVVLPHLPEGSFNIRDDNNRQICVDHNSRQGMNGSGAVPLTLRVMAGGEHTVILLSLAKLLDAAGVRLKEASVNVNKRRREEVEDEDMASRSTEETGGTGGGKARQMMRGELMEMESATSEKREEMDSLGDGVRADDGDSEGTGGAGGSESMTMDDGSEISLEDGNRRRSGKIPVAALIESNEKKSFTRSQVGRLAEGTRLKAPDNKIIVVPPKGPKGKTRNEWMENDINVRYNCFARFDLIVKDDPDAKEGQPPPVIEQGGGRPSVHGRGSTLQAGYKTCKRQGCVRKAEEPSGLCKDHQPGRRGQCICEDQGHGHTERCKNLSQYGKYGRYCKRCVYYINKAPDGTYQVNNYLTSSGAPGMPSNQPPLRTLPPPPAPMPREAPPSLYLMPPHRGMDPEYVSAAQIHHGLQVAMSSNHMAGMHHSLGGQQYVPQPLPEKSPPPGSVRSVNHIPPAAPPIPPGYSPANHEPRYRAPPPIPPPNPPPGPPKSSGQSSKQKQEKDGEEGEEAELLRASSNLHMLAVQAMRVRKD